MLTAKSTSRRYADLMLQVAQGKLEIAGERFLPGGVTERAFAPTGRRNPEMRTIPMGRSYFQGALRDYSEWPVKWWRECVQNSIDAKARNIDLSVEPSMEGYVLRCADDGSGMDEETLLDKFLTMGESSKGAAEGSVGGFGKAKELLLLPWVRWSIRTRDLLASGAGNEHTVERGLPLIAGTVLEVEMPRTQCARASNALELLCRSTVRGVNVRVDGETFTGWAERGKKVRTIEDADGRLADVYYDKKGSFNALVIRVGGLYMHHRWLYGPPGTVYVELRRASTELLTSNRDGLVHNGLAAAIDDLIAEISADTKSALAKKTTVQERVYEGERFSASEQEVTAAEALRAVGPVPSVGDGQAVEIDAEGMRGLIEVLKAAQARKGMSGASPEAAAVMLSGTQLADATAVERVVGQLVWQPAFLLKNTVEGYRIPRKFYPEAMTPQIRALAQLWADLCRWVMIQLGSGEKYGVGFIFSEEAGAEYIKNQHGEWLMLNPFRDIYGRKDVWSKTDPKDLKWLYAAAIHECTHMADGVDKHNEPFTSAFTRNVAICSDGFKKVRQIAAAVRARAPAGEAAPRRPKTVRGGAVVFLAETRSGNYYELRFGQGGREAVGPGKLFSVAVWPVKLIVEYLAVMNELMPVSTSYSTKLPAEDHYMEYGQAPTAVVVAPDTLLDLVRDWLARGVADYEML